MLEKVYVDADTYLYHCCGVAEIGGFSTYKNTWLTEQEADITKQSRPGTGMFVSTFTKDRVNQMALRRLKRKHTLLYQSPYEKNMGPDASTHGREGGISLCVFKFGKE